MKIFYLICLLCLAFCVDVVKNNKEESNRIVFDKNEWVARMQWLVQKKSRYRNEWPWNVLYYDGSVWWCDCKIILLIPLIYLNFISFNFIIFQAVTYRKHYSMEETFTTPLLEVISVIYPIQEMLLLKYFIKNAMTDLLILLD